MDDDKPPSHQQKEMLLAHVVNVIDPSNFWIQIGSRDLFEKFAQLEEQLQEFCEETGSLDRNDDRRMEDKCFVVARSKIHDSGVWRRAQIARQNFEKGTVDVFYLDYGTTEIVQLDQICAALPAFFFAVDHQAWMSGLAGIRPIAKTWTSRAVKYFQKITNDVFLQVSVVSYQATFSSLLLALYTNEGDDGRSLAHMMLEEEMGMPSDIEKVAEYARDVTQVIPPIYENQQQYENDYTKAEPDGADDECVESSYESSPASQHEDYLDTSTGQRRSCSQAICQSPTHHSQTVISEPIGQTTPDQTQAVEPESPIEAIPGFNLNSIFKTKMASADVIEQKKEDARKKAVTTAMAKDLEMVQKDMEEAVSKTEVTEWEASDYDIGKQTSGSKLDVCYQKVAEIREAIGDESWFPSMTEGHGPHKPVLQEIRVAETENHSPRPSRDKNQYSRSFSPVYNNNSTKADVHRGGSPAPGERLESNLSKQLSKIVDEGDLEDPGSLCLQFNKIVQPGGLKEPWGLAVAIEVLLETAITLSCPQQVTVLNVLDTYVDSANFEVRLQTVLKHLASRFVKPSFGKSRTYYREFGQVMGQLLVLSRLWNTHASEVTEKFVLHQLEKWAIFNRNGYQMGVQNEKTQKVYIECLEGLWDVAAETVASLSPSTYVRVQEWLQDKVLAQSHPREVRERVLKLLLKVGPVKVFNADQVRPRTACVEIQTEVSSLQDPESSALSQPENSSLFSHFDTEIEDISPMAQDTKHLLDSSPAGQSGPAPVAPYIDRDNQSSHSSHPSHDAQSKDSDSREPELSHLSSWAQSVNISKKKPKKSELRETKDASGLRALALQTLNGEKYVFSGRFVQDLPPRFKKHLDAQGQQEHVQDNETCDPHFYRKGKREDSSHHPDYQTPKDNPKRSREATPTNENNDINAQSNDACSYFSKLGLGDFPSVKDILNNSQEQTDSGSEPGSDRDTPRPRTITPVDRWSTANSSQSKKGSQKGKRASKTSRNTSSPKDRNGPGLNPYAKEWSPRKQDQNHRSLSRSPALISESSSSGDSKSFIRKQNPLPKQSHATGSKVEDALSINSIVMDIFGGGDGVKKVHDVDSQGSETEQFVVSENNTETDGANTSFCESEIVSEVDEERDVASDVGLPESCDKDKRILPEYLSTYDLDYDDDDDDFDEGFVVSGLGDQPVTFQSSDQGGSSCVDTGSTEPNETRKGDNVTKWEEMDYSKPMDMTPAKPRQPRYNWVPGQRKCTLCGDTDHTVYSCKNKKGVIF